MRFHGTLTKWNDDRGFGFITPEPAGQEIFVHVSAFARDGRRPQLNEALSFEIALNKDGKKQAAAVRREGAQAAGFAALSSRSDTHTPRAHRLSRAPHPAPRSLGTRLVMLVVACALLAAAYWQFDRRSQRAHAIQAEAAAQASDSAPQGAQTALSQPLTASPYRCDGRQHCSQMGSCAEAKFFLKNCSGVMMDGDGDGVPCEQQLCTGLFGN